PSPGSPAAENRAATSNPNSARRCRARWRSPQNSRPCASGSNDPAAPTVLPSSARNRAGRPSRQIRQSRPRSELPEADRKTHAPENTASPTRSRSDPLADRPRAPSPSRNSRSVPLLSHRINQSRLRQRAVKGLFDHFETRPQVVPIGVNGERQIERLLFQQRRKRFLRIRLLMSGVEIDDLLVAEIGIGKPVENGLDPAVDRVLFC